MSENEEIISELEQCQIKKCSTGIAFIKGECTPTEISYLAPMLINKAKHTK